MDANALYRFFTDETGEDKKRKKEEKEKGFFESMFDPNMYKKAYDRVGEMITGKPAEPYISSGGSQTNIPIEQVLARDKEMHQRDEGIQANMQEELYNASMISKFLTDVDADRPWPKSNKTSKQPKQPQNKQFRPYSINMKPIAGKGSPRPEPIMINHPPEKMKVTSDNLDEALYKLYDSKVIENIKSVLSLLGARGAAIPAVQKKTKSK